MLRWVLFNCDLTIVTANENPLFVRICHLQTGDFGWAFYHLEYSLVLFIEQPTKIILIGAYSGMIFSICMLIKLMISLELNQSRFTGLSMEKVRGKIAKIIGWFFGYFIIIMKCLEFSLVILMHVCTILNDFSESNDVRLERKFLMQQSCRLTEAEIVLRESFKTVPMCSFMTLEVFN